ncbi:PSD1 and planctomycete cytochrome C domain-containing protein [Tautonia sp. JC769]|uniref:PSD1 and planctomycete cytochrome C domain-containing protein n=1 Tax=Tautonia sp. JC769 TaxID=3232135 RepID=UPI0034574E19
MQPILPARWLLIPFVLLLPASQSLPAQDANDPTDPRSIAYFETHIRPILVERCVSCHGPDEREGGLRLDTRAAVFDLGGDSGPPVEPGDPDASLLVEAIRYDSFVQMPPSSKLPDAEIALLTDWIAHGAAWPDDATPGGDADSPDPSDTFDLAARASHWSLQPIADPPVPAVEQSDWPRNPIDRFLLARLEAEGLEPSPEAEPHTLARRAAFALTGLPPTPEDLRAFLADDRPDAFDRLVDRLLESPRYGERWARHWLDLVRFAETSGHEFDYDILTAHRYRDYVIRAFNDDVPFDQFIIEHLAGDLLDAPRRHPDTGTNESILGTMSYFFAEGTHSPVDITEEMRTRVDNQIDVLSKTFLGLTVACARCHDHKFDAITTRDYYSLAGHLQSTRHQYAVIDAPEVFDAPLAELDALRAALAAEVDPPRPTRAPSPPPRDGDTLFDDFSGPGFASWFPSGHAFGPRPTRPGDVTVDADGNLLHLSPGWAHSGAIAPGLVGVLRSKTFTITQPYVHLLVAGTAGRVNLVIDGFEKIRSPIYGGLTRAVDHGDDPRWLTLDASMWLGHLAYLELADGASSDYTGATSSLIPGDGYLAVGHILTSDHREPPVIPPIASSGPIRNRVPISSHSDDASSLIRRYREIADQLPPPTLALAAADGTGIDVPIHIRGSAKNLGAVAPRGFLEVLGTDAPDRLSLARRVADPANPLTARVLVNRLWAHHFGRGLVASPDDFGVMGTPPSHPELLDWLASEFIRSGWSIKHMHRLIMTSSAYQMSSRPRSEADAIDPDNLLLHRANLRRLDAESLRDTMLALSGRLDPALFGPSVPTHLTPFMDGRGRPRESGPLDGDGRRTLYLSIRRNFLSPFLLAFDFPNPATTRGRRDVSNVPAQALALLNDPFVLDQARRWAARATDDPSLAPETIVDSLYLSAFSRPPTPAERSRALAFRSSSSWADLCHALLNAKEFLYLD